jgi:imidazolonepropionase-like amidohydrolase
LDTELIKQKLKVAAHATTPEGIKNAITAGVDSIEHGFGADRESLEMMKDHGTFLVPTVGVIDAQLELHKSEPLSPERRQKRDAFLQGIQQSLQQALSLGVKMASGFDASSAAGQGQNANQLVAMSKRGILPLEVVRAATLNAAELMGWQDDVGSIEAGKYADLIAVEGNPLTDIAILQHVQFVMKGGTIVKDAVFR